MEVCLNLNGEQGSLTIAFAVVKTVFLLSYMALEYWLGKTQKVKANSLLEYIMNIILRRK